MLRAIGLGRRMTHREIFRAGNIGAEPSANYQRALLVLDSPRVHYGIEAVRRPRGCNSKALLCFCAFHRDAFS